MYIPSRKARNTPSRFVLSFIALAPRATGPCRRCFPLQNKGNFSRWSYLIETIEIECHRSPKLTKYPNEKQIPLLEKSCKVLF